MTRSRATTRVRLDKKETTCRITRQQVRNTIRVKKETEQCPPATTTSRRLQDTTRLLYPKILVGNGGG